MRPDHLDDAGPDVETITIGLEGGVASPHEIGLLQNQGFTTLRGQLLAAAGLVEGLTMTGYPKIKREMEEAGADFIDKEGVVDANIITSRVPDDLPAFNAEIKKSLLGG